MKAIIPATASIGNIANAKPIARGAPGVLSVKAIKKPKPMRIRIVKRIPPLIFRDVGVLDKGGTTDVFSGGNCATKFCGSSVFLFLLLLISNASGIRSTNTLNIAMIKLSMLILYRTIDNKTHFSFIATIAI